MLVNSKNLLEEAKENKIAIPQFNINNLEWTKYIIEEADKIESPVILGVSENAIKYMGGANVVYGIVANLIKDLDIKVDVVLHLDHGSSFEICEECIDAGFTSVMIDASKYEIEENIRIVKEVVTYAYPRNVTVEAEIGRIGGTEDEIVSSKCNAKLEEVIELVKKTNIDSVAPALGSVHGFYKGKPNLDFELMEKISNKVSIPLVLHGGTGIPNSDIKKAIQCGIAKININTELQDVWSKEVREYLKQNENAIDPRKIIGSGEKTIKKVVREKIELFSNK